MLSSIQVQQLSASNSAEMKGTMESLVMIVRKQGYKQLFSGLSINYLKVRGMPLIWMLIFLLSLANSWNFLCKHVAGCTICCNWLYCLWYHESIPQSAISRWSWHRSSDKSNKQATSILAVLTATNSGKSFYQYWGSVEVIWFVHSIFWWFNTTIRQAAILKV